VTPDDYVVGHVRDALATDERTGVLDVHAAVVAGPLVLTGNVTTPERREMIGVVAAEAADGLEVVNELTVLSSAAPGHEREELA
jgi:osmotically-inducible protein OsmY